MSVHEALLFELQTRHELGFNEKQDNTYLQSLLETFLHFGNFLCFGTTAEN